MNVFVELIPFITGFLVGLGVNGSTFFRQSLIVLLSSIVLGVVYNQINSEPMWLLYYDVLIVAAGSFAAIGLKKLISRLH